MRGAEGMSGVAAFRHCSSCRQGKAVHTPSVRLGKELLLGLKK